MKNSVTIKETIYINRQPGTVWDFTQDYEKRTLWDKSIIKDTVIQDKPTRIVEIKVRGYLTTRFQYKLEDQPSLTSMALVETRSLLIKGGGGSWKYKPKEQGTLWSQTNTLILKKNKTATNTSSYIT